MKLSLKSVLIVIGAILYVILLPWPVWVILNLFIFAEWIRSYIILLCLAVEIALGIFFTIRQFKKQKETKKTGSKVLFGVILVTSSVYAITAIIYLIRVLLALL